MRKSTIFLLILVAFLFVSLLFSLYLNFYKFSTASIPTPTPGIIPTETIDPTVDWKTYTNTKYGFSFKYPSNWEFMENIAYGEFTSNFLDDLQEDYMVVLLDKTREEMCGPGICYPSVNFFTPIKITEKIPLSLTTYVQKYINSKNPLVKLNPETDFQQLMIDNIPAIKYSDNYSDAVFILKNNYLFVISPSDAGKSFDSTTYSINTYFDQILSSFKFTNTIPTPTPTTVINKVKILDTSTWIEYSCNLISYKLPSTYTQRCLIGTDGIQQDEITYQEKGGYPGSSIFVKKYDGGSRRQFWIDTIQATPSEVSKYVRFQESQFGSVSGLDVFASGGWWQGGYASPILIAHDKTIVYVFGGRDYNDVTGKITRWDISDTIASTIKFNN